MPLSFTPFGAWGSLPRKLAPPLLCLILFWINPQSSPAADGEWLAISASDTPPSTRKGHTAIFDELNYRMIVFSGEGALGAPGVIWALDLHDMVWSAIQPNEDPGTPSFPVHREDHSAVYDPVENVMVIFGGEDADDVKLSDTWKLTLPAGGTPTWTKFNPGLVPCAREGHWASWASGPGETHKMIVSGGRIDIDVEPPFFDEAESPESWRFSTAGQGRWDKIVEPDCTPPESPGCIACNCDRDKGKAVCNGTVRTFYHTGIYDPLGERVIIHGGYYSADGSPPNHLGQTIERADGDVFRAPWTNPPPWRGLRLGPRRFNHRAVYDSKRHRMVFFGGSEDTKLFNDTHAYDLSGGTWSELTTIGTLPSKRHWHTAIYDDVGDRMIVFGGSPSHGLEVVPHHLWFNDLYALKFTETPPESIDDLAVAMTTQTSATVTWTTPGADLGYGDGITEFDLRYAPTPIQSDADFAAAVQVSNEPTPGLKGTFHSLAVESPSNCATYYFAIKSKDADVWSAISKVAVSTIGGCGPLELASPQPNPATRSTVIGFTIPANRAGEAFELAAFDLSGRMVRSIIRGVATASRRTVEWDLRTEQGASVKPGMYFVRLRVGDQVRNRTLLVRL